MQLTMCHDQCWVNAFLAVDGGLGAVQTGGERCQGWVEGEIHGGIVEGAGSCVQIASIVQPSANQHYVCLCKKQSNLLMCLKLIDLLLPSKLQLLHATGQ